MKRKLLTLALCAALALCALPMAAFAEGTASITTSIPESITPGEPAEFTVTTNASGYDEAPMVVGKFEYDNAKVSKLEYLETKNNQWYDLTGNTFGPETGFPLTDGATSTFRVTFAEAGNYEVTIKLVTVAETPEELASVLAIFEVPESESSLPPVTPGTIKIGSKDFEAVFANGNPARVYEKDGDTLVDVIDRATQKMVTYRFTSDKRAVFGGSDATNGGQTEIAETDITMDGGRVNYLFGASHTNKDTPISVSHVSITVNGGTVNMVQTAEQGGGMGSFDNCGKYHVGTSDIVIENGKIGAVVGGAYGYTQVDHVFVTVNGGEINPVDLTSPVQTGIMLAGTNGKVDTATLHVNGGAVNGVAAAQRCYVSSGVTYNFVGGTVGDVYLGSYYPLASEGSSAWKTWGSPTAVGNINYGQVAGQFTVNIGETATLGGLYPGYQYLLSEREAIKDSALVSGSIPAGADSADTAKTPVTIRMSPTAKAVDSYLLGGTAVTLPGNHIYTITASGSGNAINTMYSEVTSPVTEITTSVDVSSAVETEFNAFLAGDERTGCKPNDTAKAYIAKSLENPDDHDLKIQIVTSNLDESSVPSEEKALIASKGTVAQYLDISLVLSDNGAVVPDTRITEIYQPLFFNVEIPASLVKDGRTFKVVSVHEGELIEYPTTVSNLNGVTILRFNADSFSTYGLIYTDKATGNNGDNGGSSSTPAATPTPAPVLDSTPKTGAVSLVALPLAALALAGVGVAAKRRFS